MLPRAASLIVACLTLFSAEARADMLVGVYGPMTGPVAAVSELFKPGVEQAVDDINARGGVLGQKLKVVIEDDRCDPQQAVIAANHLAAKNPVAVIAASCSSATTAAGAVMQDDAPPFIDAFASSPVTSQQGWSNYFRVIGRDDGEAHAAANLIHKEFAGKKIAIIHDKSVYARNAAETVRKDLAQKGGKVRSFVDINPGDSDFSPVISKLKNEGIDVVYLALYMREGGMFVRQAAEQKFTPQIIGCQALSMVEFIRIAGKFAEGANIRFFMQEIPSGSTQSLAEKFAKRGVSDAMAYTYVMYAAVEIMAQAIQQAGSTDAEKIKSVLRQQTFSTVVGPVKFDAHGDPETAKFSLYRWKDGRRVALDA